MARINVVQPSFAVPPGDIHATSESRAAWPLAGLIASIAAVLLSQFALDGAADTSTIVHWFQHGLLFAGGLGTGLTLSALRIAGQSRA